MLAITTEPPKWRNTEPPKWRKWKDTEGMTEDTDREKVSDLDDEAEAFTQNMEWVNTLSWHSFIEIRLAQIFLVEV
jgi:hypothetical protein